MAIYHTFIVSNLSTKTNQEVVNAFANFNIYSVSISCNFGMTNISAKVTLVGDLNNHQLNQIKHGHLTNQNGQPLSVYFISKQVRDNNVQDVREIPRAKPCRMACA